MILTRLIFLAMRNVLDESCTENENMVHVKRVPPPSLDPLRGPDCATQHKAKEM